MKPIVDPDVAADAAIARVLTAERAARQSVECARAEVGPIAEGARASARRLAERTEQRVQALGALFERDRQVQVAQISAAISALQQPEPMSTDDAARLQAAVDAVARLLIQERP